MHEGIDDHHLSLLPKGIQAPWLSIQDDAHLECILISAHRLTRMLVLTAHRLAGLLFDPCGLLLCRLSRMVRSPIVAAISYVVYNYSCRPQVILQQISMTVWAELDDRL